MSAFNIVKGYAAGDPFMEADLDAFRSALLTAVNTTKFNSADFDPAMTLTSAKFLATSQQMTTVDNTPITFGASADATLGTDASKNLVFDTLASTTEIKFVAGTSGWVLEFFSTKLNVPGDIIVNEGGAARTILQAFSLYKKPVLEWASSTAVSVQNNTGSLQETVIYFPTFISAVEETLSSDARYRQASISATANGYGTGHTGAVKGGRRSGLSLTANAWYYVYACKVRSGTQYDADEAAFILVFDDVAPTSPSTLDTSYGTGCWVYLGLVRYGFGAAGSTTGIIRFRQSNKGWCSFYDTDGGVTIGGLTLAQSTANTDDSSAFYTVANGTSGNVIPAIVGHCQFHIRRAGVSDWFIKDTGGLIAWRGGWQTADTTHSHGFLVTLPNVAYTFHQTRKATGSLDKRVCLAGFTDSYLGNRRHGHGI